MKSAFRRSVAGAILPVPIAAALTLSSWGQPNYFQLEQVGYCPWPASHAPLTATVQGTHVFVIDEGGGLVSADVGDPSHPTPLARWDSGGVLMDLALAGNRAYLAAGDQGLHIVDIADPTRLTRVGGYVPGGFVFAVDGAVDRAYVAWQTRGSGDPQPGVQVDIVDTTDAAQPRRLGLIALPYDNGYGRDVHVAGEILYIAADALYSFNVSDPAHPVRSGMTILPIHSAARLARLRIADGRAYALYQARFSGSLGIYDAPSSIDSYYLYAFWPTQGNAADFWAHGRYVFLADSPFSFQAPPPDRVVVLNATDPFHPFQVGQLGLPPDAGRSRFIRTLDDYIYVGTDLGLVILKTAKEPAFLRSSQVGTNRLGLVCNDVEGLRVERSWNLINPVWQNLGAINPNEELLVSTERGQAFFRLVKP